MQSSLQTNSLVFDLSKPGLEKMSIEANKALFRILETCRINIGIIVFNAGRHQYALKTPTADFPSGRIQFDIKGCEFITYRRCLGDQFDYRYDVIGTEIIGSGNYGSVHHETATLAPHQEKFFSIELSNNVYKISARYFTNYALTQAHMPHLHLKNTQFFSPTKDKELVLRRMRRLEGTDIYTYLKKEYRTTDERLACVLRSLEAVKYQLIERRLIHCDIKIENVIYGHAANIIDTDFVRTVDDETPKLSGTRGLFAPEYLNTGIPSSKSDIYATGMMLAVILGGIPIYFLKDNKKSEAYISGSYGINHKVLNLFDRLELTDDHKIIIMTLLNKMTHPDPSQRSTIDEAIDCIIMVIFERTKLKSTEKPELLSKAISIASQLASKSYTISIADMLDYLMITLPKQLAEFSDHPDCISLFKLRSNVAAFSSAKSKSDIISISAKVAREYSHAALDFDLKRIELENLSINSNNDIKLSTDALLLHINIKLGTRNKKYHSSIDNIALLTRKLAKETKKIDQQIQAIHDKNNGKLYKQDSSVFPMFKPPSTVTKQKQCGDNDEVDAYTGKAIHQTKDSPLYTDVACRINNTASSLFAPPASNTPLPQIHLPQAEHTSEENASVRYRTSHN